MSRLKLFCPQSVDIFFQFSGKKLKQYKNTHTHTQKNKHKDDKHKVSCNNETFRRQLDVHVFLKRSPEYTVEQVSGSNGKCKMHHK